MKGNYLAVAMLLFLCTNAKAQVTLNFDVSQNAALIVGAGKDSTVKKGDVVQLVFLVYGNSGSYTYSWNPYADVIKPDIISPIASLDTSSYILMVSDSAVCIKQTQFKLTVATITTIDPEVEELDLQIFLKSQ